MDDGAYRGVAVSWQPIESAPKDETEMLGFYPRSGRIYIVFFDPGTDMWWHQGYENGTDEPACWQPLPAHPSSLPPQANE
jgi:hypothetical protein